MTTQQVLTAVAWADIIICSTLWLVGIAACVAGIIIVGVMIR